MHGFASRTLHIAQHFLLHCSCTGCSKKTRISEHFQHKDLNTFQKELKCLAKNMFNSQHVNKFCTMKHDLIFKTIGFQEKICVMCLTKISLILVYFGTPCTAVPLRGQNTIYCTG